jgi:SAM-dependent methyltransferase
VTARRLPPQLLIDREKGRRAFGADPAGYDEARPRYPDRVWELLGQRCGLSQGKGEERATLEIGPGTGLATLELAARGAHPLVVVEPDERLARFLEQRIREVGAAVDIRATSFEEIALEDASFDLAVSATAFHWIDQAEGLAKVARLLRPRGWWAAWWTVYGDPELPDPFHDATVRLMQNLQDSPSAGVSFRAPFALDVDARLADLDATAAFDDVGFDRHSSAVVLGTAEVRALYGTFSSVNVLDASLREALLDAVCRIADEEFGGRVERKLVTAIYTARRRK